MNLFEITWHGFVKLVIRRAYLEMFSFYIDCYFAEIGNDTTDGAENEGKFRMLSDPTVSILYVFFLVALDASGEPIKKQGRLETHCSWLYEKLYMNI